MQTSITITITGALAERYRTHADITKQSASASAKQALQDWMDTCGEGDIEVITGCAIDSQAERMGLPVAPCAPCAVIVN